jgi:biotin carboxyl carrier protein
MTARVLVNGKPVLLTLKKTGDSWTFESDGKTGEALIAQPETGVYHVLLDGRSYEVRVSGQRMDINGQEVTVIFEDPRDSASADEAAGVHGRQSITAPMPGKVIRVLASEGETVDRGDGIVVIEAMKMQNELKAPKAGRVTSLSATEGATVTPGQILAVIE